MKLVDQGPGYAVFQSMDGALIKGISRGPFSPLLVETSCGVCGQVIDRQELVGAPSQSTLLKAAGSAHETYVQHLKACR